MKSLDFPEGTVLPERLEGEDSEAYFQEGYGETRDCNLWEYLWMQEWLDTYITEPERAERALKELEKAFNMAYMLNKNRIVAEKEQCYNTKKARTDVYCIHPLREELKKPCRTYL